MVAGQNANEDEITARQNTSRSREHRNGGRMHEQDGSRMECAGAEAGMSEQEMVGGGVGPTNE
jgi:hypothetical protein